MNNKFKNAFALGGFIITALIAIIVLIFSNKEMENVEFLQADTAITSGKEKVDEDEIEPEEKKIIVYILGAVHEPGIIRVKESSRLYEVLMLAGGATEEADLTKVNLASNVKDEQKIMIPYRVTEEEKEKDSKTQSNFISHEISISIPETIEKNNIEEIDVVPFDLDYGKDFFENYEEGLININTATEAELITLKGIGSSTAKKIIDYRNEFGNFKTIEDIKKVKGIGEAKFEKIKAEITV